MEDQMNRGSQIECGQGSHLQSRHNFTEAKMENQAGFLDLPEWFR